MTDFPVLYHYYKEILKNVLTFFATYNCVHIFKLSCLNINPEEYNFFLSILVGTNKKLSNLGDFLDMMMTVEWLRQIVAIEKEEGSNRRETTLLICPHLEGRQLFMMCHMYIFQCYEIVCSM